MRLVESGSGTYRLKLIATLQQPPGAGMEVRLQARFTGVDIEGVGPFDGGDCVDRVDLVNPADGGNYSTHCGDVPFARSEWVGPYGPTEGSNGTWEVRYSANAQNCCPLSDGGLDCASSGCSTFEYDGFTLEGYDYRRYQAGASPTFTPLRSAGQYHDEETGLFENWNRYYDPGSGRYLQPEPLFANPGMLRRLAARGLNTAAYGYAGNNPLYFTDPTGAVVGVWGQDFGPGSDAAKLTEMLDRLRNDPCSKDLIRALDGLRQTVLVGSGSLKGLFTLGVTRQKTYGAEVVMDSEYLEAGDSDLTGSGIGTLYHELYHAYLLIVADMTDADDHHSFIDGLERQGRNRVHANKNSLIDQWMECRKKCRR